MGEKLSGLAGSVKELWNKTTKKVRVLFLSGVAGVLLLSLAIVLFLNYTDYVVLYDNLSVSENAAVLAQLQEMGVEGRLENGSLLVPREDELTVRMQLATKGYPDSGLGYDVFEMGSGLTATQFEQKKYELYQLQERLQATIRTFPEVKDAIVTIYIPESSPFVLQDEVIQPSASVKIEKMPGRRLSSEQVLGILNIVKNSIGIPEENISIADETGDLLSLLDTGGSNSAKLQLTDQLNESVRRRILSMLQPLYGDGRVNVAVNSVLDTDEQVTDTTTYYPFDPENPQNNPLDYYEREYERDTDPGTAQGVPGANDNTDVPQYAAQDVDDGTGNYYRSHTVEDYLVSSERNQIVKAGLSITDMTVAVLIDADSLPEGQRDQVIDLVASASGVAPEKVSVQSIRFNADGGITGEALTGEGGLGNYLIWIIVLGVVILAIAVTVIAVLSRRKKLAEDERYAESEAGLVDLMAQEEFEPIELPETSEQKLRAQIRDLAESDPEIVAQLIKTWLVSNT